MYTTMTRLLMLEQLQHETGLTHDALRAEFEKRFGPKPVVQRPSVPLVARSNIQHEHGRLDETTPITTLNDAGEYVRGFRYTATSKYTRESASGFPSYRSASFWLKLIGDRVLAEEKRTGKPWEERYAQAVPHN